MVCFGIQNALSRRANVLSLSEYVIIYRDDLRRGCGGGCRTCGQVDLQIDGTSNTHELHEKFGLDK